MKILNPTCKLHVIVALYFLNKSAFAQHNHFKEKENTVKIGTQIWMNKNLDVATYRNGDTILHITNWGEWAYSEQITGAWCWYNFDSSKYADKYGKLYNWYAVNDPRGIAPLGFHIPTDAEWNTLATYLGGANVAGGQLKEIGTIHWNSPNTGATNTTNFNA
jgi:uncharacterized protein (TIGR02145 family)